MSQALIDELKKENLCTHFVLPLLKLSKSNFTSAGFVNTFISHDHKRIFVKIMETELLSRAVLIHPEFIHVYGYEDGFLIGFKIPARWSDDLDLFCEGKYSKMSKTAKEWIFRYSKLPNEKKEGDAVVTDGRLLALDKHEVLRKAWELLLWDNSKKAIDQPELPDEYLSKPGKNTFINPTVLTRIRETQL